MDNHKSIAVCSLSLKTKHTDFIDILEKLTNVSVTYLCIQGRELDEHDFGQYDCVILIHSIAMGRMSITDVRDARYSTLLTQIESSLGCNRIAVLITDVKEKENLNSLKQRLLKEQKTLSRCSTYVQVFRTLDENGVGIIQQMLSGLPSSSKPKKKKSATPAKSTPSSEGGTEKIQVSKVMATTVPMPEKSPRLIDGSNTIDLIICADGSTSNTLMKSLDDESVVNMMDFKVFTQVSDQWNYVGTKTSSNPFQHSNCAVFIYWTTAPTEFTEDDPKMFHRILKAHEWESRRDCITQEELGWETDIDFVRQLSKCIDAPLPGPSIVTVTPSKPSKKCASVSLQPEADYDIEVQTKNDVSQRIRKLENKAGYMQHEIEDLETKKYELDSTVNSMKREVAKQMQRKSDLEERCDKIEKKIKDLFTQQEPHKQKWWKRLFSSNGQLDLDKMHDELEKMTNRIVMNDMTFKKMEDLLKDAKSGQIS